MNSQMLATLETVIMKRKSRRGKEHLLSPYSVPGSCAINDDDDGLTGVSKTQSLLCGSNNVDGSRMWAESCVIEGDLSFR